jgi:hypothetical protein
MKILVNQECLKGRLDWGGTCGLPATDVGQSYRTLHQTGKVFLEIRFDRERSNSRMEDPERQVSGVSLIRQLPGPCCRMTVTARNKLAGHANAQSITNCRCRKNVLPVLLRDSNKLLC